jgi:uncharacterized protein (DUF1697 family)
MRTWIGLFRGVNVGGHNKLPMKELVALLEGLGLQQVRSYLQSGNVVFRGAGTRAALAQSIAGAVARRFGFRPALLLLDAAQLARALAGNPFPAAAARPQYLHLWFLQEAPAAAKRAALETLRAADEQFALQGRLLYLHAPRGIGKSKFAARAERALGVAGTARNWRTATALLALARGAS